MCQCSHLTFLMGPMCRPFRAAGCLAELLAELFAELSSSMLSLREVTLRPGKGRTPNEVRLSPCPFARSLVAFC